ncbi:MAG TPA: hypothetical protein VNM48_06425 [Chloroflexota bacterium]|nr:hypothetical protein [Chloroflexota bacterium]
MTETPPATRATVQWGQCLLCKRLINPDDVAYPFKSGRCLCLGCWDREVNDAHPLPAALQADIERTANSA